MCKHPLDARISELSRNLRALYHRATLADIASGVAWYPNARYIVCEWATS